MWPCMRRSAVIAPFVLASLLLAQNAGPPTPAPAPASPPAAAPRERPAAPAAPARSAPATAAPAKSAARPESAVFGFANVRQLAQQRAQHDYRAMPDNLPASLANLSYDQYRDIRFRPASALWHGQALFEVQFFHRGYRTRQRVNIFEVSGAGVNPVAYNPQYFSFGKLLKPPKVPANLGYAGFRVHYPLQTPAYKDELLVFLGASYLPRARPQSALRCLGACAGDRHGAAERRGVSHLHRFLAGAAGCGRAQPDDLRTARQQERRPGPTSSRCTPARSPRSRYTASCIRAMP